MVGEERKPSVLDCDFLISAKLDATNYPISLKVIIQWLVNYSLAMS